MKVWSLPVIVVVLVTLHACGSDTDLFQPRRVDRHEEAGSTHVAVLSVDPWEAVVDQLQPQFAIDEAKALEQAIPDTQLLQERIRDLVAAQLEVTTQKGGLPGAGGEEGEDGGEGSDSEPSGGGGSGDEAAGDEAPAAPVGTPKGAFDLASAKPAVDAVSRFQSAASLFEEVRLLNRQLAAAARRRGYVPYVVRLQLSVMPRALGQPYDVYTSISFFNGGTPAVGVEVADAGARAPYVVPVLVTDALESSLRSRTLETIRQLQLAFSLIQTEVGASLGLQAMRSALQDLFARDFNSLMTVGRVSDNTIRVRIGASFQAQARRAMVPKTNNVTLLLLVDEEASKASGASDVAVVAKTEYVDTDTGIALPRRSWRDVDRLFNGILEVHPALTEQETAEGAEPSPDVAKGLLRRLLWWAQRNDRAGFHGELGKSLGHPENVFEEQLWTDLVELGIGSQYHSASFDLPKPCSVAASGGGRRPTAVFDDDGETRGELTLVSRHRLDATRLGVALTTPRLDLRPSSVTVSGRVVKAVFPSLVSLGVDTKKEITAHLSAPADPYEGGGRPEDFDVVVRLKKKKKKEQPKVRFDVKVPASKIVVKGGKGTLQIFVDFDEGDRKEVEQRQQRPNRAGAPRKPVILTFQGTQVDALAILRGYDAGSASQDEDKVKIMADTGFTVTLGNIRAGDDVIIKAVREDGPAAADIKRPVVAEAAVAGNGGGRGGSGAGSNGNGNQD